MLLAACLLAGAAGATIIETRASLSSEPGGPLLQATSGSSVDPGESFTLAGTVTYYPSGNPAVGAQVQLQRQPSGGTWATVASDTTDSGGHYSFNRKESVAGIYRYRTLVNGQVLNDDIWVVTVGSGSTPKPTTVATKAPTTKVTTAPTTKVPTTAPTTRVPTTVPTTAPTTIPTTVPTTAPTTVPTTIPAPPTTIPTPPISLPTTAPTPEPAIIVNPVVTAAPTAPLSVPRTVSSRTTTFGRRYAIGNPGSFLGTKYSAPGATTRMTRSRSVAASGAALKPGDFAYGLTPPTTKFVRWYPATRWAADKGPTADPTITTPTNPIDPGQAGPTGPTVQPPSPPPVVIPPPPPVSQPVIAKGTLTDLMNKGIISVDVNGDSIQEVTLEISLEPGIDWDVEVEVPEGTYFPSKSGGYQNMMSIRKASIVAKPRLTLELSVDVVCTNINSDIPGESQALGVQTAPPQSELQRVIPYLGSEPDDMAVQAAVWIVTDNANYAKLGTLRDGSGRVITETEATKGLRLLDTAGIDITKKAIWSDRQSLINGLGSGELRDWLIGRS